MKSPRAAVTAALEPRLTRVIMVDRWTIVALALAIDGPSSMRRTRPTRTLQLR
jgi:hypothetical protein